MCRRAIGAAHAPGFRQRPVVGPRHEDLKSGHSLSYALKTRSPQQPNDGSHTAHCSRTHHATARSGFPAVAATRKGDMIGQTSRPVDPAFSAGVAGVDVVESAPDVFCSG